MSRIGKLPISIPAGVTVTLKDNVVTVKGPKGELSQFVDPSINVAVEDGHVVLTENENAMLDNTKQRHAFHGLYRSLVNNMVVGVSEGYKKELELVGVGYRASNITVEYDSRNTSFLSLLGNQFTNFSSLFFLRHSFHSQR